MARYAPQSECDALAAELRKAQESLMLPEFLKTLSSTAETIDNHGDLAKIRATVLYFVHVATVQDNALRARVAALEAKLGT